MLVKHKALFIVISAVFLVSCGNIGYYSQSIAGQWEIISKRRPLAELLADPASDPRLRESLNQVLEIREFASRNLGLPDNNAYRSYAQLDRQYVVWNVIATPEFSLEPVEWCFIIVGCLPYRGYFSREAAVEHAHRLEAEGFDVHVGGVSAYSTLGWFDDPVLSTMLNREITATARIIFHELAHQHTYIKDDTDFNEAFADTVAQIGISLWLTSRDNNGLIDRNKRQQQRDEDFFQLVSEYKNKLTELYLAGIPTAEKRSRKSAIFKQMIADYHEIRSGWEDTREYDSWFGEGLNNARLATVLTYRDLVPALLSLYEAQGRDLTRFYRQVRVLGRCSKMQRRQFLEQGIHTPECTQ